MERSKPRSSHDELDIVKAAAWAWYEHASIAGEAKATEFDLRREWQPPPPSRYKLEAMRVPAPQHGRASESFESVMSESAETEPVALLPARRDSALFDAYEIARISKQLYSVLEASRQASQAGGDSPSPEYRPKGRMLSGFWARQAMGVCGTRVEAVVLPVARRRRNRVGVVAVETRRQKDPAAD